MANKISNEEREAEKRGALLGGLLFRITRLGEPIEFKGRVALAYDDKIFQWAGGNFTLIRDTLDEGRLTLNVDGVGYKGAYVVSADSFEMVKEDASKGYLGASHVKADLTSSGFVRGVQIRFYAPGRNAKSS